MAEGKGHRLRKERVRNDHACGGSEDPDKEVVKESGKAIEKTTTRYETVASGLVSGLQVLHVAVNGEDKVYTLVLGWDAKTAKAASKIDDDKDEEKSEEKKPRVKIVEGKKPRKRRLTARHDVRRRQEVSYLNVMFGAGLLTSAEPPTAGLHRGDLRSALWAGSGDQRPTEPARKPRRPRKTKIDSKNATSDDAKKFLP